MFPAAVAIGIFALTLLISNITALNGREVARPIEFLFCFVGVALLTPIFQPEQDKDIRDVICSKKIDYLKVCAIRAVYSILAVIALVSVFVGIMKCCESQVQLSHLFGGIASALFLGAIGFTVAGLSNNVTLGYMAAMLYYLASYGLKTKLGVFFLFSMSYGSYHEKYWLMGGAMVLMLTTMLVLKKRHC